MKENRIQFPRNPWPEGHSVETFDWTAKIVEADVWFHFHLKTANYYAEREIQNDKSADYASDWETPSVWRNFHKCTISSNQWHNGGFRICSIQDFSLDRLNGLKLHLDQLPCDLDDQDKKAFHVYLLGHDTVVNHHIQFIRVGNSDLFDISWRGNIALTYVGDYEVKHEFNVNIYAAKAPDISTLIPKITSDV